MLPNSGKVQQGIVLLQSNWVSRDFAAFALRIHLTRLPFTRFW